MFSGIVEGLAQVKDVKQLGEGRRFFIDIGKQKNLRKSYSICISGCCLTVTEIKNNIATFDVMPETLAKTYFDKLKKDDKVNMERSLRLGQEVGGHFVSGHVDCVGKIVKRKDLVNRRQPTTRSVNTLTSNSSDFSEMIIEFPEQFKHLLIDKGSIAVDGISLTVVNTNKNKFTIALIPETLKLTTLGFKKEGDLVNIEFDQMAKYVAKLMGK